MEVVLAALIKPALACYWQLSATEVGVILQVQPDLIPPPLIAIPDTQYP